MDKIKQWFKGHWPTRRRLIQLYAALLYNANLKGFGDGQIYTGSMKNLCVPGLNCYSCPGAVGACPLGSLQNALASSTTRAPYYVLGLLMLFGLTLGRLICGFLCPMGLIQELLHKLPTPKLKKNKFTRLLSWTKYVILIVFVVLIPLYNAFRKFPLPAFCKYICPAGTLEGAVGLLINPVNADKFSMLGGLFTWKFSLMAAILAACVFAYRAFCRFLCPLGAIYGMFSKVALLGVRLDKSLCIDCGKCIRQCGMDIKHVADHECIHCGACMAGCPTGAISWKGLPKKKKHRPALWWSIAIAALLGVMVWANWPAEVPAAPPTQESDLPVGKEIGMRCPDFTAPLYAGGTVTLPEGKITVLNFWATWCGPCVEELPHFQRLHENYPDDVAVIALHSELVTEDVQAWLDATNYTLPFGLDETGGIIASLGGSTMLPMTVILDQSGTIVYNAVGSVDYDFLEAQVNALLN